MNGPSIEEVTAAVRSVLEALLATEPAGPPIFAGRLLGLREAEALAERSGSIRLAPGTVVTPLARDFLKRRGVAVAWVSRGEAERVGGAGTWGFAIESGSGITQAFRRELLNHSEVWHDLGDDGMSAACWVGEASGRGAAIVTDESAVLVWRANRVEGVRAAAAVDAEGVARACRSLGLNLLVIEPSGRSIWEMKSLLHTFRRGGGPKAPAWLGSTGDSSHADRGGHRPGHALEGASEPAARPVRDRPADDPLGPARSVGRAWGGSHPL